MFCVSGSISNIGGSQYECKDGSKPEMIAGVVGAPSSVTSIQVANLLKLFKIPQVSEFNYNLTWFLLRLLSSRTFIDQYQLTCLGFLKHNNFHLERGYTQKNMPLGMLTHLFLRKIYWNLNYICNTIHYKVKCSMKFKYQFLRFFLDNIYCFYSTIKLW